MRKGPLTPSSPFARMEPRKPLRINQVERGPMVALTFHDQLGIVGHTGATVGPNYTAVLAYTPLGSVRHADRGREAPVIDHAGDHEGRVPAVPLLQDRGREGEEKSYHHVPLGDPKHRSSTHPHAPETHDFPR